MRRLILNIKTYRNIHSVAKQYNEEMVGVLIGFKAKDYLYLFHARIIGKGELTTVMAEDKAIRIINHILKKYSELDAITFHTHPLALGPQWQDKLSIGDIRNLEEEPNKSTVLVSGTGVYEFRKTSNGLIRDRVTVKELDSNLIKLIEKWEDIIRKEINRKL